MKQRIEAKGVKSERIRIVRDGTELRREPPEIDSEVVNKIRGQFRFVLVHAGNLGFYGAWETLLEGASRLAGDGIGLVFVGDGAQKEVLEAAAKGMRNVRFEPFFPGSKIPSVISSGDAHVITVKRGLEGVVVPSKMYGILASGKPIVALTPSDCDVASLGREKGFSIHIDPDDAAEFAEKVRQLSRNPEKLRSMGEAAQSVAPEYERQQELNKLVNLVAEATER